MRADVPPQPQTQQNLAEVDRDVVQHDGGHGDGDGCVYEDGRVDAEGYQDEGVVEMRNVVEEHVELWQNQARQARKVRRCQVEGRPIPCQSIDFALDTMRSHPCTHL